MEDQLNEALIILLVGMTTVFFILSIVVFVGNILINILNSTDFILNEKQGAAEVPNEVQIVISRAVQKWSKGKASATKYPITASPTNFRT